MQNEFRYSLAFFYLDLEELPKLYEDRWFWSYEKPNLACFRRKDHLRVPGLSLDEAVRDFLLAKTGARPEGPIRLLTHLRYFGYCFNPLSIYYCFKKDDEKVETILAEVHNTPWGEERLYALDSMADEHPSPKWRQFRFNKDFHVSPFMDMNMRYDWRCSEPDEKLQIHINSSTDTSKVFDATLSLQRKSISTASLARFLFTQFPMTLKVILRIYWQATRLVIKRAPYYPHPGIIPSDNR